MKYLQNIESPEHNAPRLQVLAKPSLFNQAFPLVKPSPEGEGGLFAEQMVDEELHSSLITHPSKLLTNPSPLQPSLPLGEGGLFAEQMVDEVSGMTN